MTDRNNVLIDHEELNAALAWLEEVPEGAWQSRCRLFCERFDIARLGGTARALAVWFAEYAAIRALKQEGVEPVLPSEAPRVIDGDTRSADQTSPHAAYCDIALQDSMIKASDRGEIIWIYDDALFDKSLAGNGYKIVSTKQEQGIREAARTLDDWQWPDMAHDPDETERLVHLVARAFLGAEPTDQWGKPLAPQTAKFLRGELGTHEPKE